MILLDSKNKNSPSSPLALVTPKNEKGISFSDLLRGVSEKKDAKGIQNGSLILSLGSEAKSVKPTQVDLKSEKISLKNDNDLPLLTDEEELSQINPKLLSSLTKEDMKVLIVEAKNYLKEKIQESDGYKRAQIKELPKTLGGLIEVAKKFDIDISKISFEELKSTSKDNSALKDIRSEIVKEITNDRAPASQKEPVREPVKETAVKDTASLIKDASKKEPHQEIQKEAAIQTKDAPKKELRQEMPISSKSTEVHEKNIQRSAAATQEDDAQVLKEMDKNEKVVHVQRDTKETPLFKAQVQQQHTTTEQIVQAKSINMQRTEERAPKTKADETLKLLLREEKPSINTLGLTADFSVATAKVIAPSSAQEGMRTLEQLLNTDLSSSEQNTQSAKTESLTTHKADSFEVKLNEAKQMIKYISSDIKNAIDDYRSPFTRVKIQLNPAHLGEVDLTVVQRGKNLHVNISSNNTAVNTLAMNANELRVQLNNNGINNATLNFSNGSGGGDANNTGSQHQQRQNEQRAHEEYGYFENEEIHEERLSSLEIIVPRYI